MIPYSLMELKVITNPTSPTLVVEPALLEIVASPTSVEEKSNLRGNFGSIGHGDI